MSEAPTTVPSLSNIVNNSLLPTLVSSDASLADLVGTAKRPESAKAERRAPDLRGLPPGLVCRIATAFLLAETINLDEEQEELARAAVAMDWALHRSSQKDGGAYAVLLRWGTELGTASFRINGEWKPERLHDAADRLVNACRRNAPRRLKELLRDLRDTELVSAERVAKLLLR